MNRPRMLLLLLAGALLAACGGAARPVGDLLGLAADRPTLVFFYTSG